jgi:hypothetical protein
MNTERKADIYQNQQTPWIMQKKPMQTTEIVLVPNIKSNIMIYHDYIVWLQIIIYKLGIGER